MPPVKLNSELPNVALRHPRARMWKLPRVSARLTQFLPLITVALAAVGAPAKAEQEMNCDAINQQTIPECATKETAATKASVDETEVDAVIGTRHVIPKDMWKRMNGVSWHRTLRCPSRSKLALLRIPHWDFNYERHMGEMIVAKDAANDILKVFASLFEDGYPIERMEPVHMFEGSDNKSMAANNTSAFNCRLKTSKRGLSEHSYGRAIDINPVQNPYVSRGRAQPAAGRSFKSRKRRKHKAMIMNNDAVVRAFRKVGWRWGGHWRSVKDYQHFSRNGK